MTVTDIISYLKVKYTIRGDKEYSPDIRLEDLDIELEREVTNEEFHKAAEDLKEHKKATEYIKLRKEVYPTIEDQLDKIYHEGLDSWKLDIKEIKEKYPKE